METKRTTTKTNLFDKKRSLSFDEALNVLGVHKGLQQKKVKSRSKTVNV